MKTLSLRRFAATPWGTFGDLILPGAANLKTLEPPWRENVRGASCVPCGLYGLTLRPSPLTSRITHGKHKSAWFLDLVEDRDDILIHPGNFENDTEGCILVGLSIATINGRPGIASSQRAFEALMNALRMTSPDYLSIFWAHSQPHDNQITALA